MALRAIFVESPHVTQVYEAATSIDLKKHLATGKLDLIVAHQSLIEDITVLPQGHFIVLGAKPDKDILFSARSYGGPGYLSENAVAELLQLALSLREGDFLPDPTFASWLLDYVGSDTLPSFAA